MQKEMKSGSSGLYDFRGLRRTAAVFMIFLGLLLFAPVKNAGAATIPGDRILKVPYINQHKGLWVPELHGFINGSWGGQHFEGSTRTLSGNGCGFACSAMAISYMRGEVLNPVNIMNRACGFNGVAGDRDVGVKSAAKYGFRAVTVAQPGKARIVSEILAGNPVMVLEKKSKFGGGGGHFILIMGYRNGRFAVYDPASEFKSWVCDQLTHTWTDINSGAWRWPGAHGEYTIFYAANKQVKKDDGWYLQDPDGKYLTGFQYVSEGNKTCYFGKDGRMVFGSQVIGKRLYYFDKKTGAMKTNAFVTENGKTRYYNNKGRAVTGLKKINGYYYYFKPNSRVMVRNKLVTVAEKNLTYYFNGQGRAVKGLKKIKGKYYFFSEKNCRMQKNKFVWVSSRGGKCYFNKKGRMVFGKKKINGKYYRFDKKTGVLIS
ncbi:MAG: C39 family peptidase [Eubacterium sp.]|nr:C39 family peptidase [Eubacterium sp.]